MHSETEQQRRLELILNTRWLTGALADLAAQLEREESNEELDQLCIALWKVVMHGRHLLEQQQQEDE